MNLIGMILELRVCYICYYDQELHRYCVAQPFEKQTFFVSQYTELVTEYGGWRYSFYGPESHF